MFVLNECYKAVQNSDSPYMAAALAFVLVVCIAVGIWAIIKGKREGRVTIVWDGMELIEIAIAVVCIVVCGIIIASGKK